MKTGKQIMEDFYKKMAGKPYLPANGIEGMDFMEDFCFQCIREAEYRRTNDGTKCCEILTMTMIFDPGDAEYPEEWIYTLEGPVCKAFEKEPEK